MALFNYTSWYLRIVLNVLLAIVEIIGDKILAVEELSITFRAIFDSCVHGTIAALSWSLVVNYHTDTFRNNCFQILVCGIFGTLIDVDHFIEARSLYLKVSIVN